MTHWFYERERWMGDVVERFTSKLAPEPNCGCLLWTGCVDKDGYGKFQVALLPERKQVHVRAHVFARALDTGVWPSDCVLLKCAVPACCNTEHLFEGSRVDAIAYKVERGTQARGDRNGARLHPELMPRGERHGMASIDEATALRIVTLANFGITKPETLARRTGASVVVVRDILAGESWRHLSGRAPRWNRAKRRRAA